MALTMVVNPALVWSEPSDAEIAGTCLGAAVANSTLYMLVRRKIAGPVNLYKQSLRSGRRKRLATDVRADHVLGVLDNVPVLAYGYFEEIEAWLLTRRNWRVRVPTPDVMLQTSKAIWLSPTVVGGEPTATCLVCVGGRLRLQTVDMAVALQRRDDALAMATTARRLPKWCQSLDLYGIPPSIAPYMDPAVWAETAQSTRFGTIDGRTGVSVWREPGCYLLRDVWRPQCAWSPKTHALYSPLDRARALALLLYGRHYLRMRVLLTLITRCLDV